MFPLDTKILIVDDSSFSRVLLKNALKEIGFWKLVEASNAKDAASILQDRESERDPFHLMIVDIHMPELSGLDLVRWARGRESLKDIPIIVLTSSQEKADVLTAGRLGVTHFIIKPFDNNTLKERLLTTWQRHGQKYYENRKKA